MKVLDVKRGFPAGPWYADISGEPRIGEVVIADAYMRITRADPEKSTFDLTVANNDIIIIPPKVIMISMSEELTLELKPRYSHPFKIIVVDTHGRVWSPWGDGEGVLKVS